VDRASGQRLGHRAGHAKLAKRLLHMGSTSFRVRDLPASKHPKEEREAHLTERLNCRSFEQR
jgi:hypothetical protein